MYKVVYIDFNSIDQKYPTPKDGDLFFTHGFGSTYVRRFRKYNKDIEVECWKTDPRINAIKSKTIEEVKYYIFPSFLVGKLGQFSIPLIKHLRKSIKNETNIIFNISSIRHLLFYSVVIFLKHHPVIIQHHGEGSAIFKTSVNRGLKKIYYAIQIPIEKLCFRNIDSFFVLDERIVNYLPKTNPKLLINLSTTGVDEDIFYPINKLEAKKILGWNINKKHIFFVGQLNYTKRADLLLDIYEDFIKENREDIELIFAGTQVEDPLYNRARNLGVILYGTILQTELYKFMSAANVYVLPKYKADMIFLGIGMLPVQAALCGTPVVGESLRNYAGKNVNDIGIFADDYSSIKSAIERILDQEIKFNKLRETALSYYSWERISLNTKNFYDELIKHYVKN